MTSKSRSSYYPLLMEGWQTRAAFVIQFWIETEIEAGHFVGRVEHIASYEAKRFHSLDELLDFIAKILAEIRDSQPL